MRIIFPDVISAIKSCAFKNRMMPDSQVNHYLFRLMGQTALQKGLKLLVIQFD